MAPCRATLFNDSTGIRQRKRPMGSCIFPPRRNRGWLPSCQVREVFC